jgi:hypothetical protein
VCKGTYRRYLSLTTLKLPQVPPWTLHVLSCSCGTLFSALLLLIASLMFLARIYVASWLGLGPNLQPIPHISSSIAQGAV